MCATDVATTSCGLHEFCSFVIRLSGTNMTKCHFAGLSVSRGIINQFYCLTYKQLSWVEVQKRLLKTRNVPESKVTYLTLSHLLDSS